jgi:endonuclease/exonuclease/phosphatase family metal-dependent hydrolase
MRASTTSKLGAAAGLALAALLSACSTPQLEQGALAAREGAGPDRVRVLTFNIYNHPWERSGRLVETARLIREERPDIVCLQEVARGLLLPGDPALELAQALQMHVVRFWHEENWGLFRTGIAVLSRYPIEAPEYHDFAAHGFWNYKGYLRARILLPGGRSLQLVTLHMASTTDAQMRRDELTELKGFVEPMKAQGPVLIVGDFNTERTDPVLREFVARTGVRSLYDGWKDIDQWRSWTPDYRDSCAHSGDKEAQLIDHLFVLGAGMRFDGGRIIDSARKPHPSDHCPVVADVVLGP